MQPAHAEDEVRSHRLVAREVGEAADDALLGVLADGAGVEQDHVGGGGMVVGA